MNRISVQSSGQIRELEALCVVLLSDPQPTQCLATTKPRPANKDRRWITVRTASGSEFGLAFLEEDSTLQQYQRLVRLARRLTEQPFLNDLKWVACRTPQCQGELQEFRLLVQQGSTRRTAFVAFEEGTRLVHPPAGPVSKQIRPRQIPGDLALKMYLRTPPRRAVGSKISLDVSSITVRCGRRFGTIGACTTTGGLRMKINDDTIDERDFPVQVELGVIKLTAEQLFNLRPGDEISIPSADAITGTLRIAGEPWAIVSVVHQAGSLQLTVRELLCLEANS